MYTARSAIRRADQVFCEFLSEKTTLEHGIAFYSEEFAQSPEANAYREILINSNQAVPDAWDEAESFFSERSVACGCWEPSLGQSIEMIERFLVGHGFARQTYQAMQLDAWPELQVNDAVRVLPARAMRQVFRSLHDSSDAADLAERRLDYAHFDVYVATIGEQPAGRGGLMQAGEIALIRDLYVVPELRRQRIGASIVAALLELARRLMPRIVVAKLQSDNVGGTAFLQHCGFVHQGEMVDFQRS